MPFKLATFLKTDTILAAALLSQGLSALLNLNLNCSTLHPPTAPI